MQRELIPGTQATLFDKLANGQRTLFNGIPPKRGRTPVSVAQHPIHVHQQGHHAMPPLPENKMKVDSILDLLRIRLTGDAEAHRLLDELRDSIPIVEIDFSPDNDLFGGDPPFGIARAILQQQTLPKVRIAYRGWECSLMSAVVMSVRNNDICR